MNRILPLFLAAGILFFFAACEKEPDPLPTETKEVRMFKTEDVIPSSTTAPVITTQHSHFYANTHHEDATCEKEGVNVFKCPCGHSYSEPIPKLEHVFTNWVVIREAYYMEDGIRESTCDLCGVEKKTETFPLSEKERREWDEKMENIKKQQQELLNKLYTTYGY